MQQDFSNNLCSDILQLVNIGKCQIIVKSIPYNKNGAYWPLECAYLSVDDKLYNCMANSMNEPLKNVYVDYYNSYKSSVEKTLYDMPEMITVDKIDSIYIYQLPANSYHYSMR
jgi:hypothetical protein